MRDGQHVLDLLPPREQVRSCTARADTPSLQHHSGVGDLQGQLGIVALQLNVRMAASELG
jgi:hypothetical protein